MDRGLLAAGRACVPRRARTVILRRPAVRSAGWRAISPGGLRTRRRRSPPTRRPSDSCCSGGRELLRAVRSAVPVFVVLDDFHWADAQSVALAQACREVALSRARCWCSSPTEIPIWARIDPLTAVLADLRRCEGVERIGLRGLGAEEVAAMMAAVAGHDLDAEGSALAGGSRPRRGNPFFVGEILRNLSSPGRSCSTRIVAAVEGRSQLRVALPESVREVVEHRSPARRAGPGGADSCGRDRADVRSGVAGEAGRDRARLGCWTRSKPRSPLRCCRVDRPGRAVLFSHALINHTLVRGAGSTRRARIHLRVAEALEELYGAIRTSICGAGAALAAGAMSVDRAEGRRLLAAGRPAGA